MIYFDGPILSVVAAGVTQSSIEVNSGGLL